MQRKCVAVLSYYEGDMAIGADTINELIENCIHSCVDADIEVFKIPDSVTVKKLED